MTVPNEYVELPELGERFNDCQLEEIYMNHGEADVKLDIESAPWYWGDISRSEVNELMESQPDGSFLVRNATTYGDYTLTLKKGGVNKLIKIYQNQSGKYGFSEPNHFDSVVHLVDYFSANTLQTYNAKLDIKLFYPVTKNKRDSASIPSTVLCS